MSMVCQFIQQLERRVLLSAIAGVDLLQSPATDSQAAASASTAPAQTVDDPATSPRTQWWRDAKFGMFIHWGLYSQLAGHWNGQTTTGYGEWIMHDLNIPLDQYAQVANSFDPTLFNAQQWVQVAQSAGMKYIVMTAKHHDGFSMFDTSVNGYNVVDATPWHQDPIALMSAATHAAGLHFGVYYSILDWADPNASAAGINTYMQTMETQLHELITHDHPDLLWFDGEWPGWWTDALGQQLAAYVRNLDPAIIINNRVGKRLSTDGDYDTPEQMIPTDEPAGRLWETCMTLNDTWGYKDTDNNWKSAATVVNDLKQIEAAGGNLLLNVGPTGQGIIPAPAVKILAQVGQALGVQVAGNNAGPGGSSPASTETPTDSGGSSPAPTPGSSRDTTVIVNLLPHKKYRYKDSRGHRVTIALAGHGSARVVFSSQSRDPSQIILDGTDAHSALVITGRTSIADVIVNGSLHALLAPAADLVGTVHLSGTLGRSRFAHAVDPHQITVGAI